MKFTLNKNVTKVNTQLLVLDSIIKATFITYNDLYHITQDNILVY